MKECALTLQPQVSKHKGICNQQEKWRGSRWLGQITGGLWNSKGQNNTTVTKNWGNVQ